MNLKQLINDTSSGCVSAIFFEMIDALEDYVETRGTCDCDICIQFRREP